MYRLSLFHYIYNETPEKTDNIVNKTKTPIISTMEW